MMGHPELVKQVEREELGPLISPEGLEHLQGKYVQSVRVSTLHHCVLSFTTFICFPFFHCSQIFICVLIKKTSWTSHELNALCFVLHFIKNIDIVFNSNLKELIVMT